MSITHRSRTGKTYYLHTGPKRGGGVQHFFSTKSTGSLAERVPDGFEIHEAVDGKVYLRRAQPKLVRDEEVEVVHSKLAKRQSGFRYKVEARGKVITLHQSEDRLGALAAIMPRLSLRTDDSLEEQFATYQAILRFSLVDPERRLFAPERYCFRGSVDDWISIGPPDTIQKLVARYGKHLGKDSFYELF
jgi:hypothetical protein